MANKGYTSKFRAALAVVEMGTWKDLRGGAHPDTVFNDKRTNGTRRLKLWNGNKVRNLPLDKQWKLHDALVEQFGDKLQSMYFVKDWRDDFSFCVTLKD
jgi:hypothetical protein